MKRILFEAATGQGGTTGVEISQGATTTENNPCAELTDDDKEYQEKKCADSKASGRADLQTAGNAGCVEAEPPRVPQINNPSIKGR